MIKDFRAIWNKARKEAGLAYGYKLNAKYIEKWIGIVPSKETLQQAMDIYTRWLDDQIAKTVASVDQSVDQAGI